MDWRVQSAVSCEFAFLEAQRWIENVTQKRFGSKSFRVALEDGVLLCNLINTLKPGIIKRVNRLSTPIAGLDNVNVFLKACEKLGLNEAQLFHPGDLQDVSTRVTVRREETSRRLKNVLITIYWLGKRAQADPLYTGPQLNLKAFEALEESVHSKSNVRDSGFAEGWFSDREDLYSLKQSGYRREESVESLDSVESRTLSLASDCTLRAGSEGCSSDAEAEHCFMMAEGRKSDIPRERVHGPSALRRKRVEQREGDRGSTGPIISESGRGDDLPPASAFLQWASSYQSDSDSDVDRPEPDLVQDDLASRRFRSVTSTAPVNFAVPSKLRGPRVTPMVSPCAKSWLTLSDASRLAAVPSQRSNRSIPSTVPSENGRTDSESGMIEEEFLHRVLNDGTSDSDEDRGYADPVQDDLHARRVLLSEHQTSVNVDSDKFLPKYWTPEEDLHVQKIRLGSQRRPWYKKLQGFRSKSMGDITLEPIPQESDNCSSFDQLGSRHVHQRSVGELTLEPSALQRVQREQLQSIRVRMKENEAKWHEDLSRWKSRRRSANSDLHRKREEREQRELITSGGVTGNIRTAFLQGVPEESSHKTISNHVLCSSTSLHSQTSAIGVKIHPISQTSDQTYIPVAMPGRMSDAGSAVSSSVLSGWSTTSGVEASDSLAQTCTSLFFSPPAAVVPEQSSPTDFAVSEPYQQQRGTDFSRRASLLESFYAGGTRLSATLPRGFRRSEGCTRLSMGVTPRPFGAKPSKVPSLPRGFALDDSHKGLINGQRDHIPSSLSSHEKVKTSADTGHSRSNTHPISESRDGRSSAPPIQSYVTKVTMATSVKQPASPVVVSEIGEVKVGQSEMRVCLNQKPNSGRDFGFKAHWDSTGACVNFVQAGSPAELCCLQMGDEIVVLGGCRVSDMNYKQFKGSMDKAQQNGTLLMDIRRHGQNDWGSGPPSFPYKSHKTINLTSSNSTLVGQPEQIVSLTSSNSPVETVGKMQVNGQPANGVLSKMVNGSFQNNSVPAQNKGGSESAISDLQVPSISATSSRWSWDHEEERRRQEKWQIEQERLLQEKYRRDQEKLDEEWRRAQQEFYGEDLGGPEQQKSPDVLSNGNATSYASLPLFNKSSASTSVTSNQNADKVEMAQNRLGNVQIAAAHHSQKAEVECDSTSKSQWSEESYGFAKLTVSDRTKSKSTPILDAFHKQDAKGGSKKKGQVSQAEQERLQILEEMRKRTQLLTDSSWIRPRSTNVNKEPVSVGTSVSRYESLENLHTSLNSSQKPYISSRPHSALGNTGTSRSGRSSLGPGSAIFSTGFKQSSWSASSSSSPTEPHPNSQQRGRLVSGRRMCSRCEQPLGKGAAMVIDSLELCFHIGCFKCVSCRTNLGTGAESGAQVRVRHRQLYCHSCYSRLGVRYTISK
ncbi:LIM domain only protein 7b isoform X8 [Triplophysa rosa]|uniref:LIM domain only protein 7b isoform X8 n=1 Tax=Triplophysa rosa TaxID=992332 RepID=UPI002545E4A5|nr:LIM domain only protein 7b isoform X8 [Triplophysa rosa]